MVDVHVGVALPPLDDKVDERFERRPLLSEVACPERLVAALRAEVDAEEILESALGRVQRVALHVEVHVACGRRRQLREAALLLVIEEFVDEALLGSLYVLQRRLGA